MSNTMFGECCPPRLNLTCSICDTSLCSESACGVEPIECLEVPDTYHCADCVTSCMECRNELRTTAGVDL